MRLPRYKTVDKLVGETPLQAAERLRKDTGIPEHVPLAYAGRLDPMASGKLLVLIGDECKRQTTYHSLDKRYEFEVLLGVSSDTGDVLGMVTLNDAPLIELKNLQDIAQTFAGTLTLPYPHYSSKTVEGKPLHVWTLEGRINEIEIPSRTSTLYSLSCTGLKRVTKETVVAHVLKKIETIPPVDDPRKALGRDFRRADVRAAWERIERAPKPTHLYVATFNCICTSGTYMRSLAEEIAKRYGTHGLAYAIHRTHIGTYLPIFGTFGFWKKQY